ncbi:hypothetical protein G9F73_005925 [Clostridium estertheticum]|uniref:DUF4097 domain-containing protein n=1 Tax=Clostridium estertheticum TaxID=238834 RepID=UPI0013EEC817|nr:DUF4097 domain-containing protein [Clostridium estertheticum]MBZ9607361.1 hypothetical protein [Clostridium estertheticum]
MRKIGTITSSIGLIFLGIWMIIYMNNPELGKQIFIWWPGIFILLGVEILIQSNRKHESCRNQFNYLTILIIFLYLGINVFLNLSGKFGSIIDKVGSGIEFNDGNFKIGSLNNTKKISASKTLSINGNRLVFKVPNADIKICRSQDQNIKIQADIYVKENSSVNDYKIAEQKTMEGYEVNIKESYIKQVKAYIYVPYGYNLKIDAANCQIKTIDSNIKSNIDIDASNANISLEGDIEKSNINVSNANIYFRNKLCKDINMNASNGKITVYTENKNLNVDANINSGACIVNGEKRVNKGISTKIGNGEGKLKVDIANGVVSVNSQE